jgi:hypothetical protein
VASDALRKSSHPIIRRIDAVGNVEKFEVRPRRDPVLQSFIPRVEIATTPQDNSVTTEFKKDLGNSLRVPDPCRGCTSGCTLTSTDGLTVKLRRGETPTMTRRLRLPRTQAWLPLFGPRMVVEYYPYLPNKQPFVPGVFVASDVEPSTTSSGRLSRRHTMPGCRRPRRTASTFAHRSLPTQS